MDLQFLTEFSVPIVVGICLCVGFALKYAIPTDKINRFIPLIMACLGLAINMWINNWSLTPSIMLGGFFSGLASTGLYEAFKNLINCFGKKVGSNE